MSPFRLNEKYMSQISPKLSYPDSRQFAFIRGMIELQRVSDGLGNGLGNRLGNTSGKRRVSVRKTSGKTSGKRRESVGKASEKTSEKMSEKTSEKTSEKILRLARENSQVTIAELAKKTGVTTRSVERNLRNLQDRGALRRVGADKGGHWEVINESV